MGEILTKEHSLGRKFMENNQNLIKIFEYALNQEKTGMSFF